LLDDQEPVTPLELPVVEAAQQNGAVLIDGRIPEVFASGHVRGSINVSLDGRFAEYAGDVAKPDQPIVVITDAGRESEAKVRLARIGFDQVRGALVDVEAVLAAAPEIAETARRFPVRDFALWRDDEPDVQVVDVRNPAEQADGVVPGALSVPLPSLLDRLGELDSHRPIVVYCAGGYRSSAAASLLRAHGFERVADILGGFEAWRAAGLPIEPREPEPVAADSGGS
jgi:rhodanese-related sulfurtransferase